MDKLTTADKVIFGSAIVFLISLFLPWYGITEGGIDFNSKGTDYFLTGWLPLLLAIVMVAQIAITRFSPDTKLPDTPVPWGQIHMIAGIAIAVLLVLRLLIASDEGRSLLRLRTDPLVPTRIIASEHLLHDQIGGIRSPAVGPDGAIYVATENTIWRVSPQSSSVPRGIAG